jgi:hypothetical protein
MGCTVFELRKAWLYQALVRRLSRPQRISGRPEEEESEWAAKAIDFRAQWIVNERRANVKKVSRMMTRRDKKQRK